jgi:hypothetical protein
VENADLTLDITIDEAKLIYSMLKTMEDVYDGLEPKEEELLFKVEKFTEGKW